MLSNKLFSSIGNTDRLYVDDVFSAYTYTDNSSTQTITNGIDLAGKGGLVWTKRRGNVADHMLIDTARGGNTALRSNTTEANLDVVLGITFGASGYLLNHGYGYLQANGNSSVSWTFRKAPKFFDVVTYTGNGSAGRQIAHSLGVTPGMVIVKCTSNAMDWVVQHRSVSATKTLKLNTPAAELVTESAWANTPATSSNFTVGSASGGGDTNVSGRTYVAYLFAHDTSADGLIQCGGFTIDASGGAKVNLEWEPQYLLVKGSSFEQDWYVYDSMRGLSADATVSRPSLSPNTATQESNGHPIGVAANGFSITGQAASRSYIYLAIRRSNKPPTTGTEVYNAIARTGTGAAATVTGVGFSPDFVMINNRNVTAVNPTFDRLRGVGAGHIKTTDTSAENGAMYGVSSLGMDGVSLEAGGHVNYSTRTYINHFFKRAPGFFDVVCYTGTGAAQTLNHSLGVAPELVIVKGRQFADAWTVWHSALPNTDFLLLSLNDPAVNGGSTYWNNTSPTSNVFSVGSNNRTGASARPYVAYLFASLPGVSKVGSYVGNGASQTIDCGFASGARFVLIKTTAPTYTGGWAVGDSTRGIVAGNDPVLYLNTTATEVTSLDWLDPHSSGFTVNETTGAYANTSGSTYVYLAIS